MQVNRRCSPAMRRAFYLVVRALIPQHTPPINRLTSGTSVDNYNESGITYDLNGNIQTLQRTYGSTTLIDNLTYNYASSSNPTNQVQSITDASQEQQDDYMPFGYEISRGTIGSPKNEYLYNNKEIQDENQLNLYDYGARFYDPVDSRWSTVDPHAEKYQALSSYPYVADNPLKFVDEDGKDIKPIIDKKNHTITLNVRVNLKLENFTMGQLNEMKESFNETYSRTLTSGKYRGYAVTANLITTVNEKKNKDYYEIDIKDSKSPTDRSFTYTGANSIGPNGEKAVIYNTDNSDDQTHELGHVMGNDDEYRFNDRNHDGYAQPGEVTESDPGSIMGNYPIMEQMGMELKLTHETDIFTELWKLRKKKMLNLKRRKNEVSKPNTHSKFL